MREKQPAALLLPVEANRNRDSNQGKTNLIGLYLCAAVLQLHTHFAIPTVVSVNSFYVNPAEAETELNVEVAFSEQALTYWDSKQRLKVNTSPNSPDDKLPVSPCT